MQLRRLILLAVTTAVLITPRADASQKSFDVIGAIRAPIDDNGQIVIAHEAIPGLMPAMTMSFSVADRMEAAALKIGDRVRFQLRVNDATWTAADFAVVGREAPPAPTPQEKATGRRLREGDSLPELALINQDDQPFTLADFRGHLTVMTFIFTRCPIPEFCPAMALRFAALQKSILSSRKLEERVKLLGLTLDPEFDRPSILKSYGEAVGANPAVWQFATGSKIQIGSLTKAFAVFTERNGVTLDHTLCTALISEDGRVLELWRGNGWSVDDVLRALDEHILAR